MGEVGSRVANLIGGKRPVPPVGAVVEPEGSRVGLGEDGFEVAVAVPGERRGHEDIEKTVHDRPRGVGGVCEQVRGADGVVEPGRRLKRHPQLGTRPNEISDGFDRWNRVGRDAAGP